MPYFRVILTAIAKMLSKVFSMATLTFFGRIPSRDNSKVSLMGLLSLYWLYIFISVLFPDLAEMFIPFIPDDDTIIRITSIVIFILLPLAVGFISTRMENRSENGSVVKQTLMGYPYALTLGTLASLLIVIIPLMKLPKLLKMHEQTQFAIMIRKGKYDDVLAELKEILDSHGIEADVHSPNRFIWTCFITLAYVLESIYNKKLAKRMKYISVNVDGEDVEITLHATDISMIGPRKQVYFLKHLLSEELEPENIFFTWDESVQEVEEKICSLKKRLYEGKDISHSEITELTDNLRTRPLTNEDWNAVRRQIYKLERDYFKMKVPEQKGD
ncbi:hypothetical protein CR205_00340 [Alteribacter lacisalsi]|uniref:Uncharacterized protein n=1 Tax=Alteribacter lacisalsi TaxID=2045244 RepID=A0A2W0HJ99_9BACI|nr:hypothetical protein [Alteribacter lacisalsi]PYZ97092.1 hypothetical protein CR205_00340 [Alteribacter lacisalsi]